jgi:hypothetical protein
MSNPVALPWSDFPRQVRVERRVAVRHPCNDETLCQAVDPSAGTVCLAWVRDLSVSGIGLLIERHFRPGSWFTVDLDNPECGLSLRLRVRVIHTLAMPNDHWLHGCVFERELSLDALQAFVE